MQLLHYSLSDRLFLLVLSQYLAVLTGGPRVLHVMTGYELPAHGWRAVLGGMEKRLNRMNRPPQDRKARGRLVIGSGAAFLLCLGAGFVVLTNHTKYGWYAELIILAYLIPLRTAILPDLEILSACRRKRFSEIPPVLQPLTDKDLARLDGHGLIRETLTHTARVLPRYVVAPSFWYVLGGLPLLLVCRFFSMASDMFPLTHPRTRAFAASAHFWDNLFQALPARFALILMWPALLFVPSASAREATRAWTRLPSEAKISTTNLPVRLAAYGLRISLGGPGDTGGIHRPEPWIGQGKAKLVSSDLTRALIWYGCCGLLWLVCITTFLIY